MPFDEVFSELRKKRRIRMREFEPLSGSYLHSIEHDGVLPSREKLEIIKEKIGNVAVEQGSKNGLLEQAQLEEAWWEDQFIKLGIKSEIAPKMAKLLILEADQQTQVFQTIEAMDSLPK